MPPARSCAAAVHQAYYVRYAMHRLNWIGHNGGGIVVPRRITRFCACCGGSVTLLRLDDTAHGSFKLYTDSTTQYHLGRLFLCSQGCWASVVQGVGSVEAFEEWALSPSSLVGVGATGGKD